MFQRFNVRHFPEKYLKFKSKNRGRECNDAGCEKGVHCFFTTSEFKVSQNSGVIGIRTCDFMTTKGYFIAVF